MQPSSSQNHKSPAQKIPCIPVKATTQNFMQILCICPPIILKRKKNCICIGIIFFLQANIKLL